MIIEIKVPALGESVTEATLANFLVKEGDIVKTDQPIATLSTDKADLELPSPAAGRIQKLSVQVEDILAIGTTVAIMEEGNFELPDASSSSRAETKLDEAQPQQSTDKKEIQRQTGPSAAREMKEHGISQSNVLATGKNGALITKADVIKASESKSSSLSSQTEIYTNQLKEKNAESVTIDEPVEVVKMTGFRKIIGKRLKDAQNTAAILTTFNEVDMSNLMNLRKKHQEAFQKKYGVKIGFMSLFTRACTIALIENPAVNAEIRGDDIVYKNFYHIGVAIGSEKGLIVPVIRHTNKLGFHEIEAKITEYAQKANKGGLMPSEMSGGTFTISNGGVYGSLMSTPIINPPQSAILGMHSIIERPIAINGLVVIRPMMYLALSYDHRILDGKEAVTFLKRIKELIEDPERMLLFV